MPPALQLNSEKQQSNRGWGGEKLRLPRCSGSSKTPRRRSPARKRRESVRDDGSARRLSTSEAPTHLKGLQEGVEVDEDDLGDLVLARVDEEQHVGDAQEGQQDQRGLHRFPVGRRGVTGGCAHTHTHKHRLVLTYRYWMVSEVVEARSLVIRILTMLKRKMKLI